MAEFTVDGLFRTRTTVKLPGKEVTVRALGEMEMRQCDVLARSRAALYRRKLRDPQSDDYLAIIEPLLELSEPQLRELLVTLYAQLDGAERAREGIKPRFVPEGADASLDDKLDAVDEQKKADAEADAQYKANLEKVCADYRESIATNGNPELLEESKVMSVRFYTQAEFLRNRVLVLLYFATEVDGKRYFQKVEDLDNSNRSVINRLYDSFMEVNGQDSWEISKAALQGNSTASDK